MKRLKIEIPSGANEIIHSLQNNGYEAFLVGGCVRDSILGRPIHDYDITTSATPDEMIEVFKDKRIIETGLQHGTITIVIDGEGYECTTYRIDGNYSDSRRPDSVTFTRSLKEDLKRRDFTINAMAYNDEIGLIDPFNGMADEIQDAISEELGVQPIMIDSQLLSAQRRKRLYWTNIPNITLPDDKGLLVKDVICDDPDLVKYFDDRIRNTMIKCENYIKYDLGGKGHYSQQDRLYFLDKKAPTVPRCRTETKFNVWLGGEKYKKTCPLEIERLQTLPDNYTEFGMDESGNVKAMPKTRRFEAIGNGWTVDVIAHIFSFMKL